MTVTVVDGNNLEQVLAHAGVIPRETKPEAAIAEAKTEEVEAKTEPDDVEGEDGLTPRQKREFTAAMQKTIAKVHKRRKEAEEFAAAQIEEKKALELRAADLERKLAEATPKQKEPERPKREDFKDDDEYTDALADFKAKGKVEAQLVQANVERQFANAAKVVDDFQTVINGSTSNNLPMLVLNYIRSSDMAAELAYELAKNPSKAAAMLNMTPERQLVAIGKIEGTLTPFGSSPKAKEAESASLADLAKNGAKPSTTDTGNPHPSKAREAPVIKPLSSGDGQQVETALQDMSTREVINDWQKRQKVNLSLRKRH